jgi:exosortase E/protease (VPEID-CTERM system)
LIDTLLWDEHPVLSAESVPWAFLQGLRRRVLPYLFWAAWLALLVGEALALSLSFDTNIPSVANHPAMMVRLVARSSSLLRLGMCVGTVTATALLFSSRFREDLGSLLKEGRHHRLVPGWIAGQLAAYAGFFWLTKWLIEGIAQPGNQDPRVIVWMCCGAAVLISWCRAAMPLRFWLQVLRRGWSVLLAGSVVGVFALGIGDSTGKLWDSFHGLTFRSAQGVLHLFAQDVVCHPETQELGIGDFVIWIAPECSGFEGIGLIWAFLGAYLLLFRKDLRFPQALVLIPLGTVVIWSINVLRIVLLMIVGAAGRPDVALGGFHSQAGWLGFNIVGLGLVAISQRFRLFSRVDPTSESPPLDPAVTNPTAAYLGPMLAIVATAMITGAMSNGQFDALYPARVAAAGLAFWILRKGYSGLRWSWSWPAAGIGILVFALWMALEPLNPTAADTSQTIPRALSGMPVIAAAAWLAFRVFGSVVMVPLAEELAFRGYLVRRLIAADFESVPADRFTWPSFLISSLLFGAMHQRWVAGTIAGMLYALALRHRGRLGDAVLAHATTNALIAALVLTTGAWSLWM